MSAPGFQIHAHAHAHTQNRGPSFHVTEKEVMGKRGSDLCDITKPGTSRAKGELRSICQLHGYGTCTKVGVLGG